jgi:threonine synthase
MSLLSPLRCQGCGREIPGDAPAPFRCSAAGTDGGDHVVGRVLDPAAVFPRDGDPNPFVRYRALTHAHALALSKGMGDEAFVAMVRALDEAVARVDGRGFTITPFGRSAGLSQALGLADPGGVWIKDETRNVSGSHKGRHLMGLAILGEVQARTGIAGAEGRLAIASCGNAALAAAVIARAWGRPLDVFIPADANPRVVAELTRLGASIHVCSRTEGVAGDPCYHAFREAVARGALPFCCQGSDNGLTVEGGETLAWEMAGALAHEGRTLDRLFVQVGGGALASACVQGLREARALGLPLPMPRIHPVQTRGAFPLRRAWERVVARVGLDAASGDAAIAERLRAGSGEVEEALAYAAGHRADFMWPWETEPRSVAHGILDDETYDWLAVVRGTIESGGFPVVVDEARLIEANATGRERTGIDVDPTGSAGLAGLLELRAGGVVGAAEAVGVLFSGVKR